jgi:DNA polymerase III delta prime subunit|uniref:Replication factor C C-terminal domain-containing protein n=1 Tax=viral metagenome TaxID=1070528 RepID=A0A6C0CD74_9ZZZZ
MNELLINKYKPKNITDCYFDLNTKTILENFIDNNNYNFIVQGDSGCGKSSVINILINNYYKSNAFLINTNVCYITILKDQGVNFYKNDIKLFINNYTNNGYKKFIVIEDVELFSEAIQLNFVELIKNYKSNIYFLLSTSNVLKINLTLYEMLDIIEFKKIDEAFLHTILNNILTSENLLIDDTIKKYIINLSNNSINNLINNIEKLKLLYNNFNCLEDLIQLDIVSDIIINDFDILVDKCTNYTIKEAMDYILNLIDKGYSIIDILENFLYYIKYNNTSICEENKFLIIKNIIKYINNYFTIEEDNIEIIFFVNNLYKILHTL